MNPLPEPLRTDWHELLFGVRKSIRYHDARRRFFDQWQKAITIFTVSTGMGTFVTILGKMPEAWSLAFSSCVALLCIVDLVVGLCDRARTHHALARDYRMLESEMIRAEAAEQVTARLHAEYAARRIQLEGEEPPVLRVLDIMAHNELIRAMECSEEHLVPLTRIQRALAQWCDVRLDRVKKAGARAG